jgi:hypothetical protein
MKSKLVNIRVEIYPLKINKLPTQSPEAIASGDLFIRKDEKE